MKPEILIRADGSTKIGLGHLIRCSAFAHMLKEHFKITFYYREAPDTIIAELDGSGFSCHKIANEDEFFSQLSDKTIAVLDGYHFDATYQRQVKVTGSKLVCIDDLHDKEFFADLIINHSPGITHWDYQAQSFTRFALGLEYALLRPSFLQQAKIHRTIDKIETVLICFGGSDPRNLTQTTLEIAIKFEEFKKILVITGTAYQKGNRFNQIIASDTRIDHRHALNETQMLDAMLEAELAIVPASGVLFEVLAAGCVIITDSYINNQEYILKGFTALNSIGITANHSNLKNAIRKVLNCTYFHYKSSMDGESKCRIINIIKNLLH